TRIFIIINAIDLFSTTQRSGAINLQKRVQCVVKSLSSVERRLNCCASCCLAAQYRFSDLLDCVHLEGQTTPYFANPKPSARENDLTPDPALDPKRLVGRETVALHQRAKLRCARLP